MATAEFRHYDGCGWPHKPDTANCCACALLDETQDAPNYAAWPLSYMENRRPIPAKWREAFARELNSENKAYAANLVRHIHKYGVRFTDGGEITPFVDGMCSFTY